MGKLTKGLPFLEEELHCQHGHGKTKRKGSFAAGNSAVNSITVIDLCK